MTLIRTLLATAVLASAAQAQAAIVHSSDIVGNVIFGSGNPDGSWTIDQTANMELALRAKVRYDVADDQPKPVFNANGDGTFNHAVGAPAGAPTRSRWNFEWSVNTDTSGTGGAKVGDFDFVLGIDTDAGFGATFSSYSLVGTPLTAGAPMDHYFGNNSTAEGGGTRATTPALFIAGLAGSNLMQNSSNMDFVDDGAVFASDFNPNLDGNYSFFLEARDKTTGAVISRSEMVVIVGAGATAAVSAPATLALAGLGLFGIAASRRRKA